MNESERNRGERDDALHLARQVLDGALTRGELEDAYAETDDADDARPAIALDILDKWDCEQVAARPVQIPIVRDVLAERERQEELAGERFNFTAANPGITNVERLPMLAEEVGEIARQVQQQPESGLMPVTHAGQFDWHRAAGPGGLPDSLQRRYVEPQNAGPGTTAGLRAELVQCAAICFAWIEAIDRANGTTAHTPWHPTAEDQALGPSQ